MANITFKHPTTILIAGSTGSGKTHLTCEIIRNKHVLFSSTPTVTIFFYKVMQPIYKKLEEEKLVTQFKEGAPENLEELKSLLREYPGTKKLLIFDDFMQEITQTMSTIFTQISHHFNTSVIFLTQNLFYGKKEMRDISLNAHVLILMKNPRDNSQIVHLAKQIMPHNTKFVVKAFWAATKKPHSYLLIDCHPSQVEALRLRTNIISTYQNPTKTFIPNKELKQ